MWCTMLRFLHTIVDIVINCCISLLCVLLSEFWLALNIAKVWLYLLCHFTLAVKRAREKIVIVEHEGKDKPRYCHDAKAECRGVSLNNMLIPGNACEISVFNALQNARRFDWFAIGDIKDFFHRVMMPEEDRDALRFFRLLPGKEEELKCLICWSKSKRLGKIKRVSPENLFTSCLKRLWTSRIIEKQLKHSLPRGCFRTNFMAKASCFGIDLLFSFSAY